MTSLVLGKIATLFETDEPSINGKVLLQEVLLSIFVLLPFGLIVGHGTMRLASKWTIARADLGNLGIKLCISSVVVLWVLNSVQCRALQSPTDALYIWEWISESWGPHCYLRKGTLIVTIQVLLVRLVSFNLGVFLGESFRPISLTGGIACGKSTVANMLRDNGVVIVDTDRIAHEILLPPCVAKSERQVTVPSDSVYHPIVKKFGQSILEGHTKDDTTIASYQGGGKENTTTEPRIDRRKLGEVIFTDRSKRRALNSLTHPRIMKVMIKSILKHSFTLQNVIVCADVPLLYESGALVYLFALVIVVAISPELQLERLMGRDTDLTEQQCRDRIKSQMDINRKARLSNFVLWNEGTQRDLERDIDTVQEQVQKRLFGYCRLATLICTMTLLTLASRLNAITEEQGGK